MLHPPFDIISCSWPRPVEHTDTRWTSEPGEYREYYSITSVQEVDKGYFE